MKTIFLPNRVFFALSADECLVSYGSLNTLTSPTGSPIALRAVAPAGN